MSILKYLRGVADCFLWATRSHQWLGRSVKQDAYFGKILKVAGSLNATPFPKNQLQPAISRYLRHTYMQINRKY